jgi:SAM-dependent methyltransferase
MTAPIIETPLQPPGPGLAATRWPRLLGTAAATHLQLWQAKRVDRLLADVFGYHAVQVGQSATDWLQANRMPHRWQARAECDPVGGPQGAHHLEMDTRAWPWSAASLDLVVLPHTLEWCADPHLCLREVERVLMPEGRLLVAGLQPWRWWSRKARRHPEGRAGLQPIALGRLRDWLRLLDFEVEQVALGGWTPPLRSAAALQRMAWMDRWGPHALPGLHGHYLLLATKRVAGVRWMPGLRAQAVPSRRLRAVPAAGSQSLRSPMDAE